MKEFFRFFVTAIPFTDFDNWEFRVFVIFFVVGFPSMIFGINKLSEKTPNNQSQDDA